MPVIQELTPHLADLIAAGEVVERPASVAKELIENAIDAGATRITMEIENGGITYLRITDNGCGMTSEDAPIAFRRHATSKLRTEADLSAIGTLGFRGEALAAIAAVSRIDLFTKTGGTLAGSHLHLEAGDIIIQEEAGCPDGTTIVIRDLFFNTPARMKFLKKDFTEAGYVISVSQHIALSHPEIAFSVSKDGKQVFSTSGDNRLITPVYSVFGREMTENMVIVDSFDRGGIKAWGYITKPHFCRPNRSMQHFFVNGRYIKSRLLQAALEEAFRNKIITGKYPSCAIFLQVPLNIVDVNVHPAKTEVKFAQDKPIFEAVYIACKNALERNDNIPELKPNKAHVVHEDQLTGCQQELHITPTTAMLPRSLINAKQAFASPIAMINNSTTFTPPHIECDDTYEDGATILAEPSFPDSTSSTGKGVQKILTGETHSCKDNTNKIVDPSNSCTDKPANPSSDRHTRVIGELFRTYLIAESGTDIFLIDKHAAHESMLFNQLKRQTETEQQQLLTPLVAELTISDCNVLIHNIDCLRTLGFDISSFGDTSIAVRAAPAYLDPADLTAVLSEVAEKLLSHRSPVPNQFDDLIHIVACKAAIKAGNYTSLTELQNLCDLVLNNREIASCPHGRPVTVKLTKYEIDKLFKRVNQ